MPHTYDKDPYAILGIPPTATTSQIKHAYHNLARTYHPDLNKDPRAADRMKDINWANDILSDPQERALYDLWMNSGARFNPETPSPYSTSTPPHGNPSPRATYSTGRGTQDLWAQGCSPTMFVIIFIVFMNILRSLQSTSQPAYNKYPTANEANRTAQMERMVSAMETFCMSQGSSNRCDTLFPSSSYRTFPAPSPTATGTPATFSATLLVSSPIARLPRDKFGHEDLRPNVVPGSQEWEWIDLYFPDLTTPDGLSDEVTFVYWDQLRRAVVIETRQSGTFYISIYGGSVSAVHDGPNAPSPTITGTALPAP